MFTMESFTRNTQLLYLAFVSQPANVTLLLNTDGMSVFQSSKATLRPVWLIVNEIPRRLRYEDTDYYLIYMYIYVCTYIIVQIPATKYFAGWIVVCKCETSYEYVSPPYNERD